MSDNQYAKSGHFTLKICISCLRNKVYIFGWIFVKLTQFVYLINSSNPIEFDKIQTFSEGKVAILSGKFAFLVYVIKSTILGRFS